MYDLLYKFRHTSYDTDDVLRYESSSYYFLLYLLMKSKPKSRSKVVSTEECEESNGCQNADREAERGRTCRWQHQALWHDVRELTGGEEVRDNGRASLRNLLVLFLGYRDHRVICCETKKYLCYNRHSIASYLGLQFPLL